MKVGSLFSGVGGIELGFEAEGFDTVWFVERDEYAKTILRKHWPDAIIYDDVTTIDWSTVPKVDILTGGFPCQDISNAGKRVGIKGSRSSLWRHYCEAIRILRPKYALIENVAALANRGLNVVLADLAKIGYDAEWYNLSASAVGALHRRERLFIIAYTNSNGFGKYKSNANCNKNIARENDKVIWTTAPINIVCESNDGIIAKQPGIDAELSRQGDDDSCKSAKATRVCGIFENTSNYKTNSDGDESIENKSRTLVQNRCIMEFANNARLGENKTIIEGTEIRQRDDGIQVNRVETKYTTDVPDTNCRGCTLEFNARSGVEENRRGENNFIESSANVANAIGDGYDERWTQKSSSQNITGKLNSRIWTSETNYSSNAGSYVGNTKSARFESSFDGQGKVQYGRTGTSVGEGQQGFWATEPDVGRVADGIPNRVDRIKCLGNAVVPQCAQIFAKAIKEIEGGN